MIFYFLSALAVLLILVVSYSRKSGYAFPVIYVAAVISFFAAMFSLITLVEFVSSGVVFAAIVVAGLFGVFSGLTYTALARLKPYNDSFLPAFFARSR